MNRLTLEQQKAVVRQWQRAGPALQRIHDEELANWKYDPKVVDALLELGAKSPRKEEEPNGLVEMQKWFIKIAQKQRLKPSVLREGSVPYGTPGMRFLGEKAVLGRPKLALFCSVKCPGKLISDAYDLCQRLREAGITVVGGFHSPMERECMRILLKSPRPVVWCLARGLVKRSPGELKQAVAEGRLLILSPFADKVRRQTADTSAKRNRVVADLAAAAVVVHAAPGSRTEALCLELLKAGKPVYTFNHPANAGIIQAGAKTVTDDTDWHQAVGA
jgi:hypothetical protein